MYALNAFRSYGSCISLVTFWSLRARRPAERREIDGIHRRNGFRLELEPGWSLRARQMPTLSPRGGLPMRVRAA